MYLFFRSLSSYFSDLGLCEALQKSKLTGDLRQYVRVRKSSGATVYPYLLMKPNKRNPKVRIIFCAIFTKSSLKAA